MDPSRASCPTLHLVGVVCYYGKHYSTFFLHSKTNTWLSFDDATVIEVSPSPIHPLPHLSPFLSTLTLSSLQLDPYWDTVVDKCSRGHYQPLLLLFADPNSSPVSTETAHQSTFILDASQYCGHTELGRHQ